MSDFFDFGRLSLISAVSRRAVQIPPDDLIGIEDITSDAGELGSLLTLTDADGGSYTQIVTETPTQVKRIYKKVTGNEYPFE
jgi:hypothetical protein